MPYTIPSYAVTPGAVYQPKDGGLILDEIPGAIAAWSTRRLISTAPADIARGRDALTNEEDFTAAELAGTGFTDLAGAGDGFYVTLYDQIGSNNATQSTAVRQPKGVDTGTLITDGAGVPALRFNGAQAFRVSDSPVFDVFNNFTLTVRYNYTLAASNNLLCKYDAVLTKQWALLLHPTLGVAFAVSSDGINVITQFDAYNQPIINTYNVSTVSFASGIMTFYLNGIKTKTSDLSGSITSIFDGNTEITIGSRLFNGNENNWLNGEITDAIIFNRALSDSETSTLHNDLA